MRYTSIAKALICAAFVAAGRTCFSAAATLALTPTITPGQACPDVDLGSAFPVTITGSTDGHPNRINPACGSSRASEVVYKWTAPTAGFFQVDTIGSAFDTVLHVADGASCFGPALPGGCNDDGGSNRTSLVTVSLRQGQTVLIVVDGYGSRSGSFTLHISTAPTPTPTSSVTPTATRSPTPTVTPVPICPEVDLGSAFPVTVSGSTVGHPNRIDPSCRASSASEVVYKWSAPAAGFFQMDTIGSTFDTVLHLYDGASCFGAALPGGCNDDGGGNRSSLVTVSLRQGQTILIVVDGYGDLSGSFTFHISTASTPTPTRTRTSTATPSAAAAVSATRTATPSATPTRTVTPISTCPEVVLGSALPVTVSGATVGHPNRINPPCAPSTASEVVYQWTAPAAGLFQVDTIGSTFDTMLHVYDGASCFGAALPGGCNDDSGGNRSSLVTISLRQGQTALIVVDGYSTFSGSFTLHISTAPTPTPTSSARPTATTSPTPTVTPVSICPEVALGSAFPVAVSGATLGHPNRINPWCGPSRASEVVYQWTAPTAGLFQIDTIGSTFDTMLHVYDGASCFGPALPGACNDDSGGNRSSLVTVSLRQGQTVLIVVDGYGSQSGSFALHISTAPTPTPTSTRKPTATASAAPAASATRTATPSVTPTATVTPTSICPEVALGSAFPVAVSGATLGHPNRINPSCAPSTASEVVYQWTAPTAGLFQIDTIGSTFDTVLHVHDGASCFGPPLLGACNDDGGGNRSSLVTVSLRQGQTILIVVDGYGSRSGSFALHISTAPTPTPTPSVTSTATISPTPTATPVFPCPEVALGNALPVAVSGSTAGHPNRINPSCAPSTASEVVYQWTAPVAGLFQMDTIGSTFDTVLHVYDGASCFGPALARGCNDDGGGNRTSLVTVSLRQGQTVLIVVDGSSSRSGFFSLHISAAPAATPTNTPSAMTSNAAQVYGIARPRDGGQAQCRAA